jgi:hypothetical protein
MKIRWVILIAAIYFYIGHEVSEHYWKKKAYIQVAATFAASGMALECDLDNLTLDSLWLDDTTLSNAIFRKGSSNSGSVYNPDFTYQVKMNNHVYRKPSSLELLFQ